MQGGQGAGGRTGPGRGQAGSKRKEASKPRGQRAKTETDLADRTKNHFGVTCLQNTTVLLPGIPNHPGTLGIVHANSPRADESHGVFGGGLNWISLSEPPFSKSTAHAADA